MPITVITEATDTNLTTLGQVINDLAIPAADVSSKSYYLSRLISQASDFIYSYTGRKFAIETVEETFVGRGTPRLILTQTPVISITWVKYLDSEIGTTEYFIEDPNAGFLFRSVGWTNTSFNEGWIEPRKSRFGDYDWTVKYQAGYVMPSAAGRTLPHDIERACLDIIQVWYEDSSNSGQNGVSSGGVSRERIGESEVWYSSPSLIKGLPANTIHVLDAWKDSSFA